MPENDPLNSVTPKSLCDIRNLIPLHIQHNQTKDIFYENPVIPRSLSDIRNLLTTCVNPKAKQRRRLTSKQRTKSHFQLFLLNSIQPTNSIHLPYPQDLVLTYACSRRSNRHD
uniref:Uncharacterized protein n=1 Tax=Vibrio parahaemolyticus TaxID=670 RepID=B3IUW2_VIBPH|nr:hypothetical protein [Vibrio parahaemolyticus]